MNCRILVSQGKHTWWNGAIVGCCCCVVICIWFGKIVSQLARSLKHVTVFVRAISYLKSLNILINKSETEIYLPSSYCHCIEFGHTYHNFCGFSFSFIFGVGNANKITVCNEAHTMAGGANLVKVCNLQNRWNFKYRFLEKTTKLLVPHTFRLVSLLTCL